MIRFFQYILFYVIIIVGYILLGMICDVIKRNNKMQIEEKIKYFLLKRNDEIMYMLNKCSNDIKLYLEDEEYFNIIIDKIKKEEESILIHELYNYDKKFRNYVDIHYTALILHSGLNKLISSNYVDGKRITDIDGNLTDFGKVIYKALYLVILYRNKNEKNADFDTKQLIKYIKE